MRALLALGSFLALAPLAGAGFYTPPPGDAAPTWSQDGTRILFVTGREGGALASVAPDGSGETLLVRPAVAEYALSPNGSLIVYRRADLGELRVAAADGTDPRALVSGSSASWSPDSSRIAFQDGSAISVIGIDGSSRARVATDGGAPRWSPRGDLIAYKAIVGNQPDVDVVRPDGSGRVDLTAGDPRANVEPRWSPNGRRLAFLTSDGRTVKLEVIGSDGAGRRTLPVKVDVTNGVLTWSPAGEIVSSSHRGLVAIDVGTGRIRKLRFDGLPVWSPDGARVAYSAGGECRDRPGIYVQRAEGKVGRRITNDCRIFGTAGDDELRGTPLADVLLGLGGSDRLEANDPGYVGDTLIGGAGNDALVGGFRGDTLEGGNGSDRLAGGPSGDVLSGGPGRDVIEGQGGRDTVYARDGFRDTVACGTNSPGTPERDEVFADRIDMISRDCEVVHRN